MSKFLIVVVLVLVVVAIAQLTRMYEISRKLRKKREEEISLANNKLNAKLMLVFMFLFYGFFIYLTCAYGDKLLPVAASEHGATIDTLMDINLILVSAVFFVVNTLLFVMASKYYYKEGEKAVFHAHDNKLELFWTVVPTIVLFVIIISGLVVWNDVFDEEFEEDAVVIELYSRQFDWTARYAGDDGKLGISSFNFISGTNALGLITKESIAEKMAEVDAKIAEVESNLENNVYSDAVEEGMVVEHRRLLAQKSRINSYQYDNADLNNAYDDKIAKAEFHIPVGKQIKFVFRSQDVIHSAYMPHFRAQMNTVPGMITTFKMTPTITTDSMRLITGNENFNYTLLCNKICGAAHYNMKMDIIVESEEDYKAWLKNQKSFAAASGLEEKKGLAQNNTKGE